MTARQFMLRTQQPPTDHQVGQLFARTREVCVEVGAFRRWSAVVADFGAMPLSDAIVRTVRDVDAAGMIVIDVGPDDDIVPIALIAERIGCPQSTIRRWVTGLGGPSGFPVPVESPGPVDYYRWGEVVAWLRARLGVVQPDVRAIFAAVNGVLRLRAIAPEVPGMGVIRSLLDAPHPPVT